MQPKFTTELAWQQAEFLMQPIYIRIVGQISRQSEKSTLKVSYTEEENPHLTHYVCLSDGERELKFDIWQLCYQVCFKNYDSNYSASPHQVVEIDDSPIDKETGEIDWHILDAKAESVVTRLFTVFDRAVDR
jgi:hypothetical protein